MTETTLEVSALSRRYGGRTAVRDVSLEAHGAEIVGLLGPNGAGKTTLIRLLTTVLAPSAGRFSVAGVPHTRPAEIRRRVGALPESAGLPSAQTGDEYLRYHARLHGRSRRRAAEVAGTLLAEVGLGDRGGSSVSTYSRGMRQRLGLARALVNDPVVLFLDEPTLGLDPAGHRQLLALLRDIAGRRGATVVLSTHDLPDVEEVCSQVVILDRGQVVAAGSVADVLGAVAAPRSARLTVAPQDEPAARRALDGVPGLAVAAARSPSDGLSVAATGTPLGSGLRAVVDAGVTVLRWEVDRVRLGAAFEALTSGRSS